METAPTTGVASVRSAVSLRNLVPGGFFFFFFFAFVAIPGIIPNVNMINACSWRNWTWSTDTQCLCISVCGVLKVKGSCMYMSIREWVTLVFLDFP